MLDDNKLKNKNRKINKLKREVRQLKKLVNTFAAIIWSKNK